MNYPPLMSLLLLHRDPLSQRHIVSNSVNENVQSNQFGQSIYMYIVMNHVYVRMYPEEII